VTIDTDTGAISWDIDVADISPATLAHIHSGPAGVAGPVVVDFSGTLSGTTFDLAQAIAIAANPASFYVNVHNADFPAGAIRGQLEPLVLREPHTLALMGLTFVGLWFGWARGRSRR
jgi:hypothetical protein